jgi:3-isopropylmalate/(R)-2-methylmalate dehydratase small subunit
MAVVIKGKVWKAGDNISTDLLHPGFAHAGGWEETRKYILHIHPKFSKEVQPGDVLVAGRNFGCGSGRPAASNLLRLGIGCIVAESFARLFFRNSIASALPVLPCPGVSALFEEGDELELNLDEGRVRNLTTGKELKAESLSKDMLDIIKAGGVRKMLDKEREDAHRKENNGR